MAEQASTPVGPVWPSVRDREADAQKLRDLLHQLKAERLRRGIGQEEAAGLLGLTVSDFRDFERWNAELSADRLAEYARYLGGELRFEVALGEETPRG